MIEHGKVVTKPALSEVEMIELSTVGTLEAFNTDGLRSLLSTVKAENMKEKTMRYPGHVELMRVLRETGFFDKTPIKVAGVEVRPLDVTSKLLFPRWTYAELEEEFTVLRVMVEGEKGGRRRRFTFDLYDEYDRERGESSMARTTGFPCVIAARMILDGRCQQHGVLPPERLAREPGLFETFLTKLKSRGVDVTWNSEEVSA
jgi:saccharopine dehydrogenase-like NADP-dependent oxidoreductase